MMAIRDSSKLLSNSSRKAFTLIETVVVLGLIGLMASFLLPAVQRSRDRAVRNDCAERMRQIALAVQQHHDAHSFLPHGARRVSPESEFFTDNVPDASWQARILDFIGAGSATSQMESSYVSRKVPWSDPPHELLSTVIPLYTCPADSRLRVAAKGESSITAAFTSYVGVSGGSTAENNGVLGLRPGIRLQQINDGMSNTLMLAERPPPSDYSVGWWYAHQPTVYSYIDHDLTAESAHNPNDNMCGGVSVPTATGVEIKFIYTGGSLDNSCDRYHYWSLHLGGSKFAFADGSVHFLRYNLGPRLRALATRDGGETISLD
jgi:prepilin-type N-terminal cleavage/methylation domain-containing protein